MAGKIMYCAIPTRLRHLREPIRRAARELGYVPVIPFDIGEYEDFEGGSIGRTRTLKFMLHVMGFCDATGIFGVSDGTMLELSESLKQKKDIRTFPSFDLEWETQYEKLKSKYDSPLEKLRGKNILIALVGPSAIGKTFWTDKLLQQFKTKLARVKNTTTRPPRSEQDKLSYAFISREEFEKGIKDHRFLERDYYLGNYYGTSLAEIRSTLEKTSGIFAITPKGATALYQMRFEINVAIILMSPESPQVLQRNFERRGILDPMRQQELFQASKEFVLPKNVAHALISISGEDAKDEKLLTTSIKSLLPSA
ncbi:MAG: hypothetical protein A3I24_03365 [Candidatus Harrisonbacteria bacterium RIFCSPLOWO2_02_FULL_41_13b]|uniref:Guanylate kinase-like domain-containing protein n=1 Tax=Candidatus Harrisonbacteria bacterium RIFCSPLOWO2_02_FULL_41_13b TaxID=1798409 RepID=A0A1G1ZQG2_9BACT|nr:MAG: hypothetical protein A3I24_03365 [Candidatus Harrisonbacteria bacterium RIFCSPLOWO2_02_FULL_41_13b]